MPESVGRLISAVDAERMAIAVALGSRSRPSLPSAVKAGKHARAVLLDGVQHRTGFVGIRAQNRLGHRYLTEDVGYSSSFLTDLAARLGVPGPVMDAVIRIASVVQAGTVCGERRGR